MLGQKVRGESLKSGIHYGTLSSLRPVCTRIKIKEEGEMMGVFPRRRPRREKPKNVSMHSKPVNEKGSRDSEWLQDYLVPTLWDQGFLTREYISRKRGGGRDQKASALRWERRKKYKSPKGIRKDTEGV